MVYNLRRPNYSSFLSNYGGGYEKLQNDKVLECRRINISRLDILSPTEPPDNTDQGRDDQNYFRKNDIFWSNILVGPIKKPILTQK